MNDKSGSLVISTLLVAVPDCYVRGRVQPRAFRSGLGRARTDPALTENAIQIRRKQGPSTTAGARLLHHGTSDDFRGHFGVAIEGFVCRDDLRTSLLQMIHDGLVALDLPRSGGKKHIFPPVRLKGFADPLDVELAVLPGIIELLDSF